MTRYRFYNDSLLAALIHHLKATMQPTPKPSKVFTMQTYADDKNRIIIERREVLPNGQFFVGDALGNPVRPTSEYLGQSVAAVQVQDPRTRQVVNQQMQFQFPIPASTIHEAFALFDTHQEPGFHKHLEALKIASIKQGADLSQLPKPGKN
jgi:hypothetical protein